MSTSVNIGDDIKSYLSGSNSSNAGGSNGGVTSSIGKMFQGNNVKGWFYSPLSNADSGDETSVNGDLSNGQSGGPSRSGSTASFLPNWLPGNSQPQEPSWLPSLVSYLKTLIAKDLLIVVSISVTNTTFTWIRSLHYHGIRLFPTGVILHSSSVAESKKIFTFIHIRISIHACQVK